MAIKFKTSGNSIPVRVDLVSIATEAAECADRLRQCIGEIEEIDVCMNNMYFALESLKKSDNPKEVMDILDITTSCESLLSMPSNKITVNVAMEGIGEAIKEAWRKFKELCKKFWDTIKSWFSGSGSAKVASTAEKVDKTIKKVSENKTPSSSSPTEKPKKFNPNHKLKNPINAFAMDLSRMPTFTNKMIAIAKESAEKIKKIVSEGDVPAAAGYSQWLSSHLTSSSAEINWKWHIENDSGDGRIEIDYRAGLAGKEGGASTCAEAGIKTENDVLKMRTCCDSIKKFIDELSRLPDISNYMKDEYYDPENVKNLQRESARGTMSIKAAAKLHLRFFGCLGNCVVNQQLKFINALCSAVDESYE